MCKWLVIKCQKNPIKLIILVGFFDMPVGYQNMGSIVELPATESCQALTR
ncbi:hypothetical protein SeseC_02468 [Streptococcus equi subsp. zooepidemicus ATCC 35246]|nr:hypothetical protein SeseC_02468 [Streptococcus equi subsp. zooepidemicus ATCC 35246]AIA68994.1 hypothetical protein Q426_10040 [Streptococcus equi subsp. zooepidemicus CY]